MEYMCRCASHGPVAGLTKLRSPGFSFRIHKREEKKHVTLTKLPDSSVLHSVSCHHRARPFTASFVSQGFITRIATCRSSCLLICRLLALAPPACFPGDTLHERRRHM